MSKSSLNSGLHTYGKKYHDEIKRDKDQKAKRQLLLDTIDNVTSTIIDDPTLWTQPAFKPLRSFVHVVTSKPSMYPSSIHPEATYVSNVNPTTTNIPLSKGFVCGVYDRRCLSSKDPDYCTIL